MLTQNFGIALKHQRLAKNLSLQKLSDLSGVSKSYIDYLEHGQRLPSDETIKKLVGVLEIPAEILLVGLLKDYQQSLKEGK